MRKILVASATAFLVVLPATQASSAPVTQAPAAPASVSIVAAAPAAVAKAVKPKKYKNCTALNKVYKHGVGRPGAKDKTSGKPVKKYRVNKKVYDLNKKSLDRDKDGIACEKH